MKHFSVQTFRSHPRWCMFLILFFFSTVSLWAQKREIKGIVVDSSEEPLIGVNVICKGNETIGTITDLEGKFSLNVEANATLIFSYIGYTQIEKKLAVNENYLTITMQDDSELLDEVVVVGYGTMKKKDLTGSVSRVGKEVLENKPVTNFIEFLRGSVAGFNTTIGNTSEGGGQMLIRGENSLKANTQPLIVLDGSIYYGSLSDINPNDIESLDVLKDASSSAIYGARGAAGVIMVNTKKGVSEKPVINVSTRIGFTEATNLVDIFSPSEYLQVHADYYKTQDYFSSSPRPTGYYDHPDNLPSGIDKDQWGNYDSGFTGDYIGTWLNRIGLQDVEVKNYKAGKITDWRDMALRTGLRQDYNVSVSGKSKLTNYFLSMGYVDNEGYLVGDEYQNFRTRINLETEITKWLTVGVNSQFANRRRNNNPADLTQANNNSPYGDMYDEEGKFKWFPHDDATFVNPFMWNYYTEKFVREQTLMATTFAKVKLPFGFSYQANFQNRFSWLKDFYADSPEARDRPGGRAARTEYSVYEWMVDNILNWNMTFADIHKFDATFVYNVEKYQDWKTYMINNKFEPDASLGFHNMGAGSEPQISSDDQVHTANAFLGRINYNLMDRYYLTASVRRDGYSAFGANNPYATFPAVALAWRISDEDFMQNDILNHLKLRASWGENGNREFGRYAALATLGTRKNIVGGNLVNGLVPGGLGNRNLKWERTTALNFGLDFGIFNDRITGIIDFYKTKTNDLLLTRRLPNIIGYDSVAANMGELGNTGVEITLNSLNMNIPGKFTWTSTLIYTHNKNKIKHLYGDMVDVVDSEGKVIGQREADDETNGWYIGHGLDEIYDYKFIGVWQLGEEAEAAKYGSRPGDAKLLDVNGDGVIDSKNDKVWLGRKSPTHRLSLRNSFDLWNCLNISFLLRSELGWYGSDNRQQNNGIRFFHRGNTTKSDYWTPENPSNEYCRLAAAAPVGFSNWKSRNYLRLQDFSISYTVPKQLIRRLGIQDLRVNMMVDNAFVITNWKNYDPEINNVVPRTFTFGVNFTL